MIPALSHYAFSICKTDLKLPFLPYFTDKLDHVGKSSELWEERQVHVRKSEVIVSLVIE